MKDQPHHVAMNSDIQAEVYKSQRLAAELMASQTRILELLSKSSSSHSTGPATKKNEPRKAIAHAPSKGDATTLECTLCKCAFTGEKQKAHHLKAARHRKVVADYQKDHGIVFAEGKTRCSLCKLDVDGEFLPHHVITPAHLELKAQAAASAPTPQVFTAANVPKVDVVEPLQGVSLALPVISPVQSVQSSTVSAPTFQLPGPAVFPIMPAAGFVQNTQAPIFASGQSGGFQLPSVTSVPSFQLPAVGVAQQ